MTCFWVAPRESHLGPTDNVTLYPQTQLANTQCEVHEQYCVA